jgi:hypothetical protein
MTNFDTAKYFYDDMLDVEKQNISIAYKKIIYDSNEILDAFYYNYKNILIGVSIYILAVLLICITYNLSENNGSIFQVDKWFRCDEMHDDVYDSIMFRFPVFKSSKYFDHKNKSINQDIDIYTSNAENAVLDNLIIDENLYTTRIKEANKKKLDIHYELFLRENEALNVLILILVKDFQYTSSIYNLDLQHFKSLLNYDLHGKNPKRLYYQQCYCHTLRLCNSISHLKTIISLRDHYSDILQCYKLFVLFYYLLYTSI